MPARHGGNRVPPCGRVITDRNPSNSLPAIVDIRQLRYFIEVARHGNFSRAAQQLYVAQPALSRSIRLLEEELEVRLFERHSRGVTPTREGRELLDRAQYLIGTFDRIKTDIRDKEELLSGPLGVGMTPNFALMVGGQLISDVLAGFPQAELKIVEAYSPALRDMLRDGRIDIAVLSGGAPASSDALAVDPLFEDQLCLIGRASDPLMQRECFSVAELHELPLALTGLSSAGVRNEIEKEASRQRVRLNVVLEVGSMALAAQVIRLGIGYTVYVASGLPESVGGVPLAAVPIDGLWLGRSLAWPADRPLSRLASEVIPVVRSNLLALVETGSWRGARVRASVSARARATVVHDKAGSNAAS